MWLVSCWAFDILLSCLKRAAHILAEKPVDIVQIVPQPEES